MPQVSTYTLRNYKVISTVVLIGSYLVVAAITILLLININIRSAHVLGSLAVCGVAFFYLIGTQILARLSYYHATAYLLVTFYALLAAWIAWKGGVNTPIAMLIFALVIEIAGILLAARHALFAAVAASLLLLGMQTATTFRWHTPNMSGANGTSNFSEVFAYCAVFGMLALISWLYNREMEHSLLKAKQAEIALLRQKATLKTQVRERTAELRKVQMEEMRHMYNFAELGQLGVILLHDLANHLSALTLEIEDLKSKRQAKTLARAQQIIQRLERMVETTRERLHGSTEKQTFNILRKTSEAIEFLRYKATKNDVTIEWQSPARSWEYMGDPSSFSQVIAILVSNAIDAYNAHASQTNSPEKSRVAITMQRNEANLIIRISDWGKGVTKSERKHLFKPTHSTKKSGLGLGLYIAKQTIEMQFLGTIEIDPLSDHTEFVINLPLTRNNEK